MTDSVKINFSQEELNTLQELATSQGQTIASLIRIEALKLIGVNEKELTVHSVDKVAELKPVGTRFAIRELYPNDDWITFSKRSRLSVGRKFFNEVTNPESILYTKYKFVEKSGNNAAIYERI